MSAAEAVPHDHHHREDRMTTTMHAPTPTMHARIETITVKRAKELLANNHINRTLARGRVLALAGAMSRGEWMLNGEPIKIGSDGSLLDGQHRCHGVVESGVPIKSLVIYGVDSDAQKTMDIGAKRTLADYLSMRGVPRATTIAAATRIVNAYEHTTIPVPTALPMLSRPTQIMAIEAFERHPRLAEFTDCYSVKTPLLSPAAVTAYAYIFSYVDEEDSRAFFDLLASGTVESGSAIFALRERFYRHVAASQRPTDMLRAALTFKSFNFWRDGTPVAKLQAWRGGGASPDQFPQLNDTTFPFRLLSAT